LGVGRFSEKRESMPLLCVVPSQKYVFCCADFGSTFVLDVQQKLKLLSMKRNPFSAQDQTLRSYRVAYIFRIQSRHHQLCEV